MPLKIEQTQNGHNPFDEISCPACEENNFISMDHASVWCDKCNAQFFVRHTSGDPGYVVDCFTEHMWKDDAKYPELKGESPYCIVKNGEPPRWIVVSDNVLKEDRWSQSIEQFVEKHNKYKKIKNL